MTKSTMTTGAEVAEYLGGLWFVRVVEVNPHAASVAIMPSAEAAVEGSVARAEWKHAVEIATRRRGLRVRFGAVVSRVWV